MFYWSEVLQLLTAGTNHQLLRWRTSRDLLQSYQVRRCSESRRNMFFHQMCFYKPTAPPNPYEDVPGSKTRIILSWTPAAGKQRMTSQVILEFLMDAAQVPKRVYVPSEDEKFSTRPSFPGFIHLWFRVHLFWITASVLDLWLNDRLGWNDNEFEDKSWKNTLLSWLRFPRVIDKCGRVGTIGRVFPSSRGWRQENGMVMTCIAWQG